MKNETQQSNSITIANSKVLGNNNATSKQHSLLQFQYFIAFTKWIRNAA